MSIVKFGEYQLDLSRAYDKSSYIKQLQNYGEWDVGISKFLRRVVAKNNMFFVDIGANIGYFSFYVNALSNGITPVIAIEPCPKNFEALEKNIKHNGFDVHTTCHCAAVGAKKGKQEFHFNDLIDHASSFYNHGDHPYNTHSQQHIRKDWVDVISLNSLNNKIPKNKDLVIKIDTEGAEIEVLKGANRLLKRHSEQRIYILAEINGYGLRHMGQQPKDVFDYMHKQGYEAYIFMVDNQMKHDSLPIHIPHTIDIKADFIPNVLFTQPDNIPYLWDYFIPSKTV